jgi:hypothetical protein
MKKSMVNAAFWCYFNMLTQLVYINCLKTLEDEVYGEDPVFEFTGQFGLFPFRPSNFLFHGYVRSSRWRSQTKIFLKPLAVEMISGTASSLPQSSHDMLSTA